MPAGLTSIVTISIFFLTVVVTESYEAYQLHKQNKEEVRQEQAMKDDVDNQLDDQGYKVPEQRGKKALRKLKSLTSSGKERKLKKLKKEVEMNGLVSGDGDRTVEGDVREWREGVHPLPEMVGGDDATTQAEGVVRSRVPPP